MQIALNNEGFIIGYAIVGAIVGGITVDDIPQEVKDNYQNYKYVNGEFIKDNTLIEKEKIKELQELKKEKIILSKQVLADFLKNNPLPSMCHDSKLGFYSCTFEKQQLIINNFQTYFLEEQLDMDPILTWNETGKSCEIWTKEEILQLLCEMKAFVYPIVNKQQKLEEQINNCDTLEQLNEVIINYEEFSKTDG